MKRNAVQTLKAIFTRMPMAQGMWIQSPTDFEIANDVINGSMPYYAYEKLDREGEGTEGTRTNRMLFRLANYLQPDIIVEAGATDTTALHYMAEARRKARHIFAPGQEMPATATPADWAETHTGSICNAIEKAPQGGRMMIHFATTAGAEETANAILIACRQHQHRLAIVMEAIHRGKKREIWKNLITDKNICKTFDLYDTGIAIFGERLDKARHYKMLF